MATAAPEIQIAQELLDDLELGEIVDAEEASGVSMSIMKDGGSVPFKFVVALAWVIRRRDDPEFTFAQALKFKTLDLVDIFTPTPAAPLTPLKGKASRGNS